MQNKEFQLQQQNSSNAAKTSEDQKTFMQQTVEDPLKKREQFAVSLRREKTKQIISAKRRRLIDKRSAFAWQPNISGNQNKDSCDQAQQLSMSDDQAPSIEQHKSQCLDMNNPNYFGYYKFFDDEYFHGLIQEISPGFNLDGIAINQIKLGIDSLVNENMGSPIHQLALITAIRHIFTREDEYVVASAEALRKTPIMSILIRILDLKATEEEFYFIKLEALWILINLAVAEEDDLKLMLQSHYPGSTQQPSDQMVSYQHAQQDFDHNKSELLIKVEKTLSDCLNQPGGADMKILQQIVHLYSNLVITSAEFAMKMLRETSLLHMMHHLITNDMIDGSNIELLDAIAIIPENLIKNVFEQIDDKDDPSYRENQEIAQVSIGVCHAVIQAEGMRKETHQCAFRAMKELAEKSIDMIKSIATHPCVERLVKEIKPHDSSEAIMCLSNFFASDEDKIVMWAFQGGFLPSALEILNTGIDMDRRHILFGLSNITGGQNREHISIILEETYLMDRILQLTQHSDRQIKGESTWVITNAISQGDHVARAKFVSQFGQHLIHQLCNVLRDFSDQKSGQEVIQELLTALNLLLNLDQEFPDEFTEESSIGFMVDCSSGFDTIEQLQMDPNEDIFQKARDIMATHYPGQVSEKMEQDIQSISSHASSSQQNVQQISSAFQI